MSDFSNRIVGLYEKHAAAWDRDRQNGNWNDKVWHGRFVGRLARGRWFSTWAVARDGLSRSLWSSGDCA